MIDSILGLGKRAPAETQAGPAAPATLPHSGEELSDAEITKLVDGLLAPILVGPSRYERRQSSPLYEGAVDALRGQWTSPKDQPPTDAEKHELRGYQAKCDSLDTVIDSHSRVHAADAHEAGNSAYAKAAAAGQSLEGHEARSRREIDAQFEARRTAAKQEIRNICMESWPTAAGVLARFVKFARGRTEQLVVAEFRNYHAFGVPFSPSTLVLTLADICANVEGRIAKVERSGVHPRPKDATLGLVEL